MIDETLSITITYVGHNSNMALEPCTYKMTSLGKVPGKLHELAQDGFTILEVGITEKTAFHGMLSIEEMILRVENWTYGHEVESDVKKDGK